jgi:hypothetical protein
MISQAGHVALIVPRFARRTLQSLRRIGVYEYLGEHHWKTWVPESGKVRIVLW